MVTGLIAFFAVSEGLQGLRGFGIVAGRADGVQHRAGVVRRQQGLTPSLCYMRLEVVTHDYDQRMEPPTDDRVKPTRTARRRASRSGVSLRAPGLLDTHSIGGRVRYRGHPRRPERAVLGDQHGDSARVRALRAAAIGQAPALRAHHGDPGRRLRDHDPVAVRPDRHPRRAGRLLHPPPALAGRGARGGRGDPAPHARRPQRRGRRVILGGAAECLERSADDVAREPRAWASAKGSSRSTTTSPRTIRSCSRSPEVGPLGLSCGSPSSTTPSRSTVQAQTQLANRPEAATARSWATALLASLAGLVSLGDISHPDVPHDPLDQSRPRRRALRRHPRCTTRSSRFASGGAMPASSSPSRPCSSSWSRPTCG